MAKRVYQFKLLNDSGKQILRRPVAKVLDPDTVLQDAILDLIQNHTQLDIDSNDIGTMIADIQASGIDVTNLRELSFSTIESSNIPMGSGIITVKIAIGPTQDQQAQVPSNAWKIMMTNANATNYLPYTPGVCFENQQSGICNDDEEHVTALQNVRQLNFQGQIKNLIGSLLQQLGMGYRDNADKGTLETFVNSYSNVLCYVEKCWKSILLVDFPAIPRQYSAVKSLRLLTFTVRKQHSTRASLTRDKLSSHIASLEVIKLPTYRSSKKLKKVAESFMNDEIKCILSILDKSLIRLANDTKGHARTIFASGMKPQTSTNLQPGGDNTTWEIYDPAMRTKSTNQLRPCTKKAIVKINKSLFESDPYAPFVLSDTFLGLDDSSLEHSLSSYRRNIKDRIISTHYLTSSVCLYTHSVGGNCSDMLAIFKVPSKAMRKKQGDNHAKLLHSAIQKCNVLAPNAEIKETSELLAKFLSTYAGVKNKKRTMRYVNSILCGEHKEVETLIESGSMNENMIDDLRKYNSRGGMGEGHTAFSIFYDKCSAILRSNAGAHERRKEGDDDTLYGSTVISIPDLRRKVIDALEKDVEKKILAEMPPIPSEESIRLQFVPNSTVVKAVGKMTGHLNVIRHIQSRTLRREHQDQHWVNCLTRYYKEWLVDLKKQQRQDGRTERMHIMFVGQDDKAKIPVGDDVPVGTGARHKTGAIVPVDESLNHNKAADHDWSKANIIPSVTLFGNIPDEYGGSFYSGGADGDGKIQVVLRDGTFDPSDIFDHCAELYAALERGKLKDYLWALVLQTDGGMDHNITFLRTKLALIALFRLLDVDHFVALRGAPYGSYLNIVERSMSLFTTKRVICRCWRRHY